MNQSPPQGTHLTLDPLNPPTGYQVLSIIQYTTASGQVVQDVQSSLMKDLRNEDYIMMMMDSAKKQLGQWFKEQKEIRKIK